MLKHFTNIVLYTSIFISLGGSSLIVRSSIILRNDTNWKVVLFVFFSTLFTYNLTKIIPLWSFWKNNGIEDYAYNKRNKWNIEHKKELHYVTLISLIGLIVFVTSFTYSQLLFLSHLGLISLLYATPIFSGKELRTFPLIKVFLIAYVWGAISILPGLTDFSEFNAQILFLFLENFCFVLAITIPFDIRDFSRDRSQGIQTLPSFFGIKKAKVLSILLIILSSFFSYYIFEGFNQLLLNVGFNLMVIPLLIYSKEHFSEYYYLGLIDGTLIARLVILFI